MKKAKNKLVSNLEEIYKNSVIRKCRIEENIDSMRLDKYLGNRFSYYSRNKWQDLVGQGLVLVNGKRIKYTREIKKGDEIVYHLIGLKEPDIDKNIQIIYDDGDLIIVNKPANLPVIPSGKYYYNTLHTIMKENLNCNINMLNRIDRETSGCVVMSRGHELASKFCSMHSKNNSNKIKKTYIAIVENAKNIEDNFIVEGYLEEIGNIFYRRYQILNKDIEDISKPLFAEQQELIKRNDVMIAVGGDGTTLNIAKSAAVYDKLTLGINAGRLGFIRKLNHCSRYYLSSHQ